MKLIPNAQTWTATLDFLKTESLDTLTDKSLFYFVLYLRLRLQNSWLTVRHEKRPNENDLKTAVAQ